MDLLFILSVITFFLSNSLTLVLFFAFFENKEIFNYKINILNDEKLPYISVIIPVYNEESSILNILKKLDKSDYPKEKLDIIIVDDKSTDKTRTIIKNFIKNKPYFRLIERKQNGGAAAAKNTGIKHAKHNIIITLDSDTLVEKNTIKNITSEFLQEKYDAMAGAVKVYKPKNWLERLQYIEYNLILFFRRVLLGINSVSVTPGALSIYKKEALDKFNGFDEKSITEDQEIAFVMQKNGYNIGSSLHSIAFTIAPSTIIQLFKQRIRWVSGGFYNRLKHKDLANFIKYGDFSIFGFFFDLFFAFPFLLFVITLFLIATDPSKWFQRMGWEAVYMSIDGLSLMLSFTAFLSSMFSLYMVLYIENISQKGFKVKWYDYLIFLLFYGLIWFVIWPFAIIKFIRREYTWGTR